MSARAWRSRAAVALHRLRLLEVADRLLLLVHAAATRLSNRRFVRSHPDFPVPPLRLAFETLGHVSASEYRDSGRHHAKIFAALIRERIASAAPTILEWGSGSGRIIRQLKAAGLDPRATLVGVDVDEANVAWCRAHLPGIEFRRCAALPPLPADDRSLDAVYHYSVWTHLSQASIEAWVRDIARALRDDGVMIGTSHGERYMDMLLPAEAQAYRAGHVVERRGFSEGGKRFVTFHPPDLLDELLRSQFEEVHHTPSRGDLAFPQDLWVAQRPRRP